MDHLVLYASRALQGGLEDYGGGDRNLVQFNRCRDLEPSDNNSYSNTWERTKDSEIFCLPYRCLFDKIGDD